jgi:hypothetical protein
MNLVAGLLCALMTPAACGAVGSPSANPDHGAPASATGLIEHPVRPAGIPNDFLEFTWQVAVYDSGHHLRDNPAIVRITATSKAPIQGNVHGKYPYRLYTKTAYSHTIWTQPGVQVQTGLTATADPLLPNGWYLECTGTSNGWLVEASDFTDDPSICIMSHLITGGS